MARSANRDGPQQGLLPVYRGILASYAESSLLPSVPTSAEDSLNICLRDVTATGRDGRVSQLDQVYIRGSMCRALPLFRGLRASCTRLTSTPCALSSGFYIVPDMLANAPMFVPPRSSRCCHATKLT